MEKLDSNDFAKPEDESPSTKEEREKNIDSIKEILRSEFSNSPEEFLSKGLYAKSYFLCKLMELYNSADIKDIDFSSLIKQCAIYQMYRKTLGDGDLNHPPNYIYSAQSLGININDEWTNKIINHYLKYSTLLIDLSKEIPGKEVESRAKEIKKEFRDGLMNDPLLQVDSSKELLSAYAKVREKYYTEKK